MVDSGTFKTSSFHMESPNLNGALKHSILKNTDKKEAFPEAVKLARSRGIDPSSDLGKLGISFGGFSPTAMEDNLPMLKELAEAAEQRILAARMANEHAAALESARASESREFEDASGTWTYVVLDESEIRIEKCISAASSIEIPTFIEDMPVSAIASDACSSLENTVSITIPASVASIGYSAFRDCGNLESIEFPSRLSKFDPGWLRGCHKLERMRLPGGLEKITPAIFDVPNLRKLEIGDTASEIMAGAFGKSRLTEISVSIDNPFIKTDGKAIYSLDGSIMVALAVPCKSYAVMPECMAVARKAFSSFEELEEIELPETIEVISDFSFTRTSIRLFKAPSALKAIGERAFFACGELRTVILNEGLEAIGANAFSETRISELRLPYTIRKLGNPIAAGTPLAFSGEHPTFSIAEPPTPADAAGRLSMDGQGGLYRLDEDGLHLVRMLEPESERYVVADETIAIDDGAFAKHPSINEVVLPEGIKSIGKGAFKDARKLAICELPNGIEELGEEAFLDTALSHVRIPASLVRIGSIALVAYGAHHGGIEPALRDIDVDSENPRFYKESGLLVERMGGFDRVILCTGENPDVVVPSSVTAIAPYAFNGVRTLRNLTISEKVQTIEIRGLAFDSMVDVVHIDLVNPIEGHEFFEFRFPKTARAAQQMGHAFGTPNFINVEGIFDHYDNTIVNRTGFDVATDATKLTPLEQGQRIIERLREPILMSNTNRSLMEGVLEKHLEDICVDCAKHDEKDVIEGLLELGFITSDNIGDVIEAVGAVQDASITNYLLEQKQRRFGSSTVDFSL